MGIFELLITAFSAFIAIAGTACTIIVPLAIFGVIGYFLYKRSQQSNTYRQAAQSWPSTTGRVLSSSLQSRHTGRSHSIYPVVIYQYEVNGINYRSQIIKAGDQFMSVRISGQAQATVAHYPAGASVTVYYNPANPGESALER